jgi:hypothetical protein
MLVDQCQARMCSPVESQVAFYLNLHKQACSYAYTIKLPFFVLF